MIAWRFLCFLQLLFLSANNLAAQVSTWCSTFGRSNTLDFGQSITKTVDGGFAITGRDDANLLVLKIDNLGNEQWKYVESRASTPYTGNCIIQSNDYGFAVCATTTSGIIVLKINSQGTLQWSYHIAGSFTDQSRAIIQSSDGGYVLAGQTNSTGFGGYDAYICKLSSEGNLLWSTVAGGAGAEATGGIIQTNSGDYIIAGQTSSFGQGLSDVYILKLTGNGNMVWSKTIGGSGNDWASSIIKTDDGGYVIAGGTESYGAGNADAYIIRFDSSNNIQWATTVGGPGYDHGISISKALGNGFALTGFTDSYGAGAGDLYLIKLNENGALQWTRTLGDTDLDIGCSITQAADGGLAIVGYSNSYSGNTDVFIVKTDNDGNTCGCNPSSGGIAGSGFSIGPGGTTYTSGASSSVPVNSVPVFSSSHSTNICSYNPPPLHDSIYFFVFPSLASDMIWVQYLGASSGEITIFDMSGKTVIRQPSSPPGTDTRINCSLLSKGVYYLQLITSSGETLRQKFAIVQ